MPDAIDSPYPLSPGQLSRFNEDGFVHLPGVLPLPVVNEFGPRITARTLELAGEARPFEERSTYDRAFLQVMNLWEADAAVRDFVMGKRLARLAAGLLGVSGVRLYHDQSLYKEPGGGLTPAHADQYYWPLATDRVVTAWIPLQDVPLERGPLGFYAGSHHETFGRELAISDDSEREICRHMEARGFDFVEEPFLLGDVSFHLGWTFHRAGPNRSTVPRSVMTIIYMDAGMRLKAPVNAMQHNDWQTWCPGATIGEVIDTPKNPVIYAQGGL